MSEKTNEKKATGEMIFFYFQVLFFVNGIMFINTYISGQYTCTYYTCMGWN